MLVRRAETRPDRVFLQEVGGASRTFGELHERSLFWAGALRGLGVEAGDNVATMLPTSVVAVEVWLGIAWLRARDTGINLGYRGRMLQYVVGNCKARVMIVSERMLATIREVASQLENVQTLVIVDTVSPPTDLPFRVVTAEELSGARPVSGLTAPERHDIACVVYTSGTTGASKGVLVPWGLMSGSNPVWSDLTEDDVFYSPFPMFHSTGRFPLAWAGFPGGRVVIRESFKTEDFWEDVRRYGCTTTQSVPAMLNWLLDQPPRADDADNPMRNLVTAPVIPRIEEFKQRFDVRVRTVYGMTETGMVISTGPDVSSNYASCGTPTAGYEVRLVDEHDYDVPVGQLGELILRSDQPWALNAGYFEMPDKTAEAWRNGWFHTGDGLRADAEGNLYFIDRINDAIRRRGENVSSFEVEAFVNEHPAVAESAAIGVPSDVGEEEIKILVVLRDSVALEASELIDFLADRMPAFMVPRYVEFVDALPKTDATQRTRKVLLRENALNERTWDRLAATSAASRAPSVGR